MMPLLTLAVVAMVAGTVILAASSRRATRAERVKVAQRGYIVLQAGLALAIIGVPAPPILRVALLALVGLAVIPPLIRMSRMG